MKFRGFPDVHPSVTQERLIKAVEHSLFGASPPYGFCLKCGEDQSAEPDAEGHKCHSCNTPSVYGAEILQLYL
jgi:hypothetical protein